MNNETQNTPKEITYTEEYDQRSTSKEDADELFAEYISSIAEQIKNALIECSEESEEETTEEVSPLSSEHEDYYRDQRHQEKYDQGRTQEE